MTQITISDIPLDTPAQRLRRPAAAVRVHFTWLGVRQTLTKPHKAYAAEPFGAQGEFLSAVKNLLRSKPVRTVRGIDTNHRAAIGHVVDVEQTLETCPADDELPRQPDIKLVDSILKGRVRRHQLDGSRLCAAGQIAAE